MKNVNSIAEKFSFVKEFLEKQCELKIEEINSESESSEYSAYNFRINSQNIVFRISKITPTKVGQFVSVWKRNTLGITEPYSISDRIDFYMIACFAEEKVGIFIFPKDILIKEKIMSDHTIEGKRGIRVYPAWDKVMNTQAQKTKAWQEKYFVDLSLSNKKAQKQLLKKLLF